MPVNISNSTQPSLNSPLDIQQQPTSSHHGFIGNTAKVSNQPLSLTQPMNEINQGTIINTVTENYVPPHTTLSEMGDTSSPSGLKHKGTNEISDKSFPMEHLPTEIIQNIAFKLDVISYVKLRSASSIMEKRLPSLEDINKVFLGKYSGKTKNDYMSIYKNMFIPVFESQQDDSLMIMLNSLSFEPAVKFSAPFIKMSVSVFQSYDDFLKEKDDSDDSDDYHSDETDDLNSDESNELAERSFHRSDKYILDKWKLDLTYGNPVNKNHVFEESRDYNFKTSCYDIEYLINTKPIDADNLDLLIGSFDSICFDHDKRQMFLTAIAAHRLITYLNNHTPVNIAKSDIAECKSQYPMMFGLGEALDTYLSTKQTQL